MEEREKESGGRKGRVDAEIGGDDGAVGGGAKAMGGGVYGQGSRGGEVCRRIREADRSIAGDY